MKSFNYELINDYVSGQLAGNELAAFEKELHEDSDLANEVKLYASIEKELKDNLTEDKKQEALKTSLQHLNQQYFTDKKNSRIIKLWPWLAGSAAAAILLFIFLNPLGNDKFDNKKLYSSYNSEQYKFSYTERGTAGDSVISEAAALYNRKKFTEALPLFLQAQQRVDDDELKLLTAICQLQTEKDFEAVAELNTIISGKSVYADEALWYKALLLLKQNKMAECVSVLKLISVDSEKYKEARKLLSEVPH